jgi:undecaprenyl phosphate N,N'-diacetylbacillosamine 1-phosphate transferase
MYKKYIKRIIDVVFSILLLIPLAIVFLVVSVIIKIDDGGPVLFNGERLGMNGKKFKMYKFRSMKVNAPDLRNENGSTFNSPDDERVTRFGKILRATSIDEVPQILNVLKGEMSLIGPRATMGNALSTYLEDEKDKLKVRPGISGYCQAYYRNRLSAREKRLKDAWYANNLTFCLDLKIFFKTIITVLKHEGVYHK